MNEEKNLSNKSTTETDDFFLPFLVLLCVLNYVITLSLLCMLFCLSMQLQFPMNEVKWRDVCLELEEKITQLPPNEKNAERMRAHGLRLLNSQQVESERVMRMLRDNYDEIGFNLTVFHAWSLLKDSMQDEMKKCRVLEFIYSILFDI